MRGYRDDGWGRGEEALALSDQGQEAGEGGESASRTQLLLLRKGPAASCPELGHHHWWREGVQAAGAEIGTSVKVTRCSRSHWCKSTGSVIRYWPVLINNSQLLSGLTSQTNVQSEFYSVSHLQKEKREQICETDSSGFTFRDQELSNPKSWK